MAPITQKTRVAIVGASGYSGEELVGLLLNHPDVELTTVTSRQYAGRGVADVFPKYARRRRATELQFVEPDPDQIVECADLVFLALPHGVAIEYAVAILERGRRVIDLSADFRLRSAAVYEEYYGKSHPFPELLAEAVYGLPEFRREEIRQARIIASPGCYPTSILMPLIPLLQEGAIDPNGIIANSLSGVTGAGRKEDLKLLFAECNESVRAYGFPKHRHLSEIEQELTTAAGQSILIQFTPHLVPVNRGILTTIYVTPSSKLGSGARIEDRVRELLSQRFAHEPFVRVTPKGTLPDTKNVVGSNGIEIGVVYDSRVGRLVLSSAEDNLVKGASGQAVQSMNVLLGLEETAGLD